LDRRLRVESIARLLVTLPALFLAFGPPLADLNSTHVTNPLWTSHARLHTVWLVCTNSLISLLALALLWHGSSQLQLRNLQLATTLVAAVLGGFFVAVATQPIYHGALTDPNGIPFKIGPLDANLAAFSVCALSLLVAIVLARRPAA
jgi:hypothetical protein